MNLPFFYKENIDAVSGIITLDEDTSKHVVQVLRMQNGEELQLTDGKGNLFTASITDSNRKKCSVTILQTTNYQRPTTNITIAISLVKNASRFEWFLEKATELGVSEIIPLLCARTEKQHFRYDRMKGILISAMLQSQQRWLPVLHEPTKLQQVIATASAQQKFIAHCTDDAKRNLADVVNKNLASQVILIGPEGDFTPDEIQLAMQHHFIAVALGETRLRTETAGIAAASLLCLV